MADDDAHRDEQDGDGDKEEFVERMVLVNPNVIENYWQKDKRPLCYFKRWRHLRLHVTDYEFIRTYLSLSTDQGDDLADIVDEAREDQGLEPAGEDDEEKEKRRMRREFLLLAKRARENFDDLSEKEQSEFRWAHLEGVQPAQPNRRIGLVGWADIEGRRSINVFSVATKEEADEIKYSKTFGRVRITIQEVENDTVGHLMHWTEELRQYDDDDPGEDYLNAEMYVQKETLAELEQEIRQRGGKVSLDISVEAHLFQYEVDESLAEPYHSQTYNMIYDASDAIILNSMRVGAKSKLGLDHIHKKWLEKKSQEVHEPKWGKAQYVRLLETLSGSALDHSQREGLDQYAFEDRLADIDNLLSDVQQAANRRDEGTWTTATEDDEESYETVDNGDSEDEDDEKEDKRWRRGEVWIAGNLQSAFLEGTKSKHASKIDRHSLTAAAAQYLTCPWLRSAELEQIIVAALVYDEAFNYGEELKQKLPGGPRDSLLGLFGHSWAYWRADGNIEKMTWFNIKWSLGRLAIKFGIFLVLPVVAAIFTWIRGYRDEALIGGVVYVGLLLIWLVIKVLRKVFRAFSKEQPLTYEKQMAIWTAMYGVFEELDSHILSPTRVREALADAASKGVVWESAVWAVVDSAIARNAAVWDDRPASASY